MSEVDRSRYLTVTRESVAAAADEAARYMGGPFRFQKGNRYYLRFMPAFKVNAQGLPQWWSFGMRHYGIPLIAAADEDGKKLTMDCPMSIGARCIPCENAGVFKRMGAWDDFKGCSPRKRVYFNVIDIQNIEAGVQVLEDGPKLWGLLREEFEEENDKLFDPFEGSVLIIHAKEADPWRKLKYPKEHQCSLEEIHEDALTWALPENLNDLDEQWDFPSLEQQQETFAFLSTATQIAMPAPQEGQIAAPVEVATGDQVQRVVSPAPVVPTGVAAILEGEVIEGEVVEAQPAPAVAPSATPETAVTVVTPAAVLEEASQAVNAAPAAEPAAIIAEAAAAAGPVPDDAAPAPAAAPAAGGGSSVLLQYKKGMDEGDQEMPD